MSMRKELIAGGPSCDGFGQFCADEHLGQLGQRYLRARIAHDRGTKLVIVSIIC